MEAGNLINRVLHYCYLFLVTLQTGWEIVMFTISVNYIFQLLDVSLVYFHDRVIIIITSLSTEICFPNFDNRLNLLCQYVKDTILRKTGLNRLLYSRTRTHIFIETKASYRRINWFKKRIHHKYVISEWWIYSEKALSIYTFSIFYQNLVEILVLTISSIDLSISNCLISSATPSTVALTSALTLFFQYTYKNERMHSTRTVDGEIDPRLRQFILSRY